MYLNTFKNALGERKSRKRVGRGIGSGFGKTCGRGHKGQKSRSSGSVQIGFEGGQMPLQRRLPKVGFRSRVSKVTAQLTLSELNKCEVSDITLAVLKNNNLVNKNILNVKVILSGIIDKSVNLEDIKVSKGAKVAIEAAGGSIA
jgi:large subunit ribosomal protein L15